MHSPDLIASAKNVIYSDKPRDVSHRLEIFAFLLIMLNNKYITIEP